MGSVEGGSCWLGIRMEGMNRSVRELYFICEGGGC